jgi:hypothetical protein
VLDAPLPVSAQSADATARVLAACAVAAVVGTRPALRPA